MATREQSDTGVITREETETREPPMYKVILLNDDYSTMEFVVMILETVFNKSYTEAHDIMMTVHNNGLAIAGIYTKEIAETKIASVHHLAKLNEFPLRCTMERN